MSFSHIKHQLISVALLLVLIVANAGTLWNYIENTAPYTGSIDEFYLPRGASNILVTGTLHPTYFNYPSLPIYISAVGMAAGRLFTDQGHLWEEPFSQLYKGRYQSVEESFGVRFLFSLLSIGGWVALAFIGYLAFKDANLIYMAPLAVLINLFYFRLAVVYVNVDIAAVAFSTFTILSVLYSLGRPTIFFQAILPAILSGAAIACKYQYGLLLLPCLTAILWTESKKHRLRITVTYLSIVGVSFFVAMPYAFIEFETWINAILKEIAHYQGGHQNFESFSFFANAKSQIIRILSATHWSLSVFGIVGLVSGFQIARKETILITMCPLILFLYMCSQKANFERNFLLIHLFASLFIAMGIVSTIRFGVEKIKRIRAYTSVTTFGVSVAICLGFVLIFKPIGLFERHVDSRKKAADWILKNVDSSKVLLIAREFSFYKEQLNSYKIIERRFENALGSEEFKSVRADYILFPEFGSSNYEPQSAPQVEQGVKLNGIMNQYPPETVRFGDDLIPIGFEAARNRNNPIVRIVALADADRAKTEH